jgi:hypothetical protein
MSVKIDDAVVRSGAFWSTLANTTVELTPFFSYLTYLGIRSPYVFPPGMRINRFTYVLASLLLRTNIEQYKYDFQFLVVSRNRNTFLGMKVTNA